MKICEQELPIVRTIIIRHIIFKILWGTVDCCGKLKYMQQRCLKLFSLAIKNVNS